MGFSAAIAFGGMMLGSAIQAGQNSPQPPPMPEMPQAPTAASITGLDKTSAQQKKRAQAGQGRSDTVVSGPQGLGEVAPQNMDRKSLLGY